MGGAPASVPMGRIAKRFFSWDQLHSTTMASVDDIHTKFGPTLLVGISGGGLVPARMLRSGLKIKYGKTIPIQCVGAVHYDDDAQCVRESVQRTQWLDPAVPLSGARLLLIDEVDDSRKTLAFIVAEFMRFFEEARAVHEAVPGHEPWVQPALAVYVIHNKVRPKEAAIHPSVYPDLYFVGENQPNYWHVYPWDAVDIATHTAIAQAQAHYFSQRPHELALAWEQADTLPAQEARSANVHYQDGGSTAAPTLETTPTGSGNSDGTGSSTCSPLPARVKSALTSAMFGASPGSPRPAAQPAVVADGAAEANGGVRDPVYDNLGYVPGGLAPRFGSLTLVDHGLLGNKAPHR